MLFMFACRPYAMVPLGFVVETYIGGYGFIDVLSGFMEVLYGFMEGWLYGFILKRVDKSNFQNNELFKHFNNDS